MIASYMHCYPLNGSSFAVLSFVVNFTPFLFAACMKRAAFYRSSALFPSPGRPGGLFPRLKAPNKISPRYAGGIFIIALADFRSHGDRGNLAA